MASLTLRKAVEAALGHFKANADLLGAITNQDVTFEEAELSEDGAYWHIRGCLKTSRTVSCVQAPPTGFPPTRE